MDFNIKHNSSCHPRVQTMQPSNLSENGNTIFSFLFFFCQNVHYSLPHSSHVHVGSCKCGKLIYMLPEFGYFGKELGVNVTGSRQFGRRSLSDTSWRHTAVRTRITFFFCCFYLHLSTWASTALALGGILSLSESPERLCGFENVTGVFVDIAMSRNWVNHPFWK